MLYFFNHTLIDDWFTLSKIVIVCNNIFDIVSLPILLFIVKIVLLHPVHVVQEQENKESVLYIRLRVLERQYVLIKKPASTQPLISKHI